MDSPHLLITAKATHKPGIAEIWRFLYDCPGLIGMHIVKGPIVEQTSNASLMGIVIIAESHISVHYERGWLFVDVFSCMPFDTQSAIAFVESRLPVEVPVHETQVIRRGAYATATAIL